MAYHNDLDPGMTLDFDFTTVSATGAPTALVGGALKIRKDDGLTTSVAGVTLSANLNLDGAGAVTGLNGVRITLASDGTFYSSGSRFQVIISAGTIGGVSAIGYVAGDFSIRADSALKSTTAGRTADVQPDGSIPAGNMLTAEQIADEVALRELIAGQVLDKTGYAHSSASIIAFWAAAVRELSASGNAAIAAAVQAALAATLAQITGKTDALPTDPADASDIVTAFAAVTAAVATRASQASLDAVDDLLDTEMPALTAAAAAVKAKTDQLTFTTPNQVDATAVTGGGGLTAPQAAQLTAIEADANTIVSAIDPTGAADIDTIKAKTDQLTFTTPNVVDASGAGGGGGLTGPQAAQLTAIESKTAPLPTDPADQSLIMAAIAAIAGAPSSADNATAVWANVIEAQGSITAQQALSIGLAVLGGVTSNTGLTFKTPNGSAVRVVATVNALNERLTITLTPSAP